MNRLFLFSTLIIVCCSLPRTPRIYNVLISTKKNLSPSHALPVYEPVLRTTSLGLAFPPSSSSLMYYYNTAPFQSLQISSDIQSPSVAAPQQSRQIIKEDAIKDPPPPPPLEQQQFNLKQYYDGNVNDPKNMIANLKRNPDIPDVKPPPLPLRHHNNQ